MIIKKECSMDNLEAWGGAVDTLETLKEYDKLKEVEQLIEEIYPDGIDETALNDLLWFDSEFVYESVGIPID